MSTETKQALLVDVHDTYQTPVQASSMTAQLTSPASSAEPYL